MDARFDATVHLMGRGVDPLTADLTVSGGIARAQLSGAVVDTANLVASLGNGRLLIDVKAEGEGRGAWLPNCW